MITLSAIIVASFSTHCLAFAPLADKFQEIIFINGSGNFGQQQTVTHPPGSSHQDPAGHGHRFSMSDCHGFQIEEATIDELQEHLHTGSLSTQQLSICYLQRFWQINDYLASVLELNPDFLPIAAQLDAERQAGRVRSPLHGIPFTVKDNIASQDRMQTTAGSWALHGSTVPRDAHVVAKLRDAGALLFGKAALSEWADMRSNNYSEGYSARGGQVRSPYNLTTNPGGSSSGSAVGVAANVFAFALGTETDGSVINPAERNAIVGLKPTVGLTSRAGVIPESLNQDSVGIFAKTVREAAYVLDAIHGPDERDTATLAQIGRTPKHGYCQFVSNKTVLSNATFGVPWNSFWTYATAEQQEVLFAMLEVMKSAGATIINETEIQDYSTVVSPDGWNWDYGMVPGHSQLANLS
jgi:amidase